MTVAQFKEFLEQLASLYECSGRNDFAMGLRKFAEAFDGTPNQKLAQFLQKIRTARGL